MTTHVDIMIHVNESAARPRLEAQISKYPGVVESRIKAVKPNLLFVSYDPLVFDIRAVPEIARGIGARAQVVDI